MKERTTENEAAPIVQDRGGEMQTNGRGLQPDLTAAASFLQWIDAPASGFCFRTFPDLGNGVGHNYNGPLSQHAAALAADNTAGRGVFVVVNAGGHRGAEINQVRAVFADLDGAPLAPVLACDLLPHIVVESSPGRFHAYWLCDGLPLAQFKPLQQAIAARFASDASVCDLPRVMRLPGFIHTKGSPFLSRVIQWNAHPRFTAEQVLAQFPPVAGERVTAPGTGDAEGVTVEDAGTRHADLIALAVRLARSGVSQATALAAVEAEDERGRWSRDVPEGERAAAVSSAFAKIASGEITREVDPWAVGFGRAPLPPGVVAVPETTGPRFKLTPAGELVKTPKPLQWLVRDMLLPATSSMLVGDPAAGKSLLVIEWAACVALGRDWLGRPVASGLVVYLAGEGHHGIARRLKAWSLAHLAELDAAALVVSDRGASLNEPASLRAVVEAIDAAAVTYGMPVLVVVDTLHRNLAGDENSAADTAAYFQAVDVLRTRYGAHVLTVHHSGHASKDRGRGSSSLRAAVDTELLLGVAGDIRTLTVSKQKDGPTADPMHFQLQEIALPWLAADGEPETSVILAPSMAGPSRLRQLPPSLRLALDTLRDCGDGPVSLESWRAAFYERHPGDNAEAKRKAFHRVRGNLLDQGAIAVQNDNYRITDTVTLRDIAGHVTARPVTDRDTPLKGVPVSRSATAIFGKDANL